jgi:hypothetical protein
MMRFSRSAVVATLATLALLASCAGDGRSATGVHNVPFRFVVTNYLLAPVTIAIDGSVSAIVNNGKSTNLTVASSAQWLVWTSAKPADSHGVEIPDDVGPIKVSLSGIGFALDITNVIHDTTYVTASMFNESSSQVLIGVYDGDHVACVSVLGAKSGVVRGFTQTGYYRLTQGTEFRAYRDGSNCTGPYVTWPKSQLAAFQPKSGLLFLTLDSAP